MFWPRLSRFRSRLVSLLCSSWVTRRIVEAKDSRNKMRLKTLQAVCSQYRISRGTWLSNLTLMRCQANLADSLADHRNQRCAQAVVVLLWLLVLLLSRGLSGRFCITSQARQLFVAFAATLYRIWTASLWVQMASPFCPPSFQMLELFAVVFPVGSCLAPHCPDCSASKDVSKLVGIAS